MQLTFGEAGQCKHVAIFDHETLETGYVINTKSPRFHIVEDLDKIGDVSDSYVQIKTKEDMYSKFDMRNKLSKLGAREIEFVPVESDLVAQGTNALDQIAVFVNNQEKLIVEYVNNLETTLDKKLLQKIGISIVKGE